MIHTNNNIGITNVIALQDSQISDLLKLDELAKKKQALKHEIRNGLGGLKCDLDLLDEQKATVKEYNRLLNSLKERQAIVKQALESFRDARG